MSDGSIDVLKDFDTVDFVASLNRLHIIGLSGHAVNCFENYLSGIAGNPLLFSQYWTMCPMVQYRGHFCSLSVVIFLHSVSLLDFFWHKGISVVFFLPDSNFSSASCPLCSVQFSLQWYFSAVFLGKIYFSPALALVTFQSPFCYSLFFLLYFIPILRAYIWVQVFSDTLYSSFIVFFLINILF